MKKVLYSTTALAAAGLLALSPADAQAAEKVKLGLGGFYIWMMGAGDSDAEAHKGNAPLNMVGDSEVYFRGNTTLDNGIRVDVIVQLESDQVNGGIIDESYIKVGNLKQWGEFRLGSTKQAHFLFRATGPHVSAISNATNFAQSHQYVPSTTPLKGPATFFNHAGAADRMSLVYVTPNLNGVQGGISFTPGQANSDVPPATDGENATDTEVLSLGGNYKGKFGDASVAVSGGWTGVSGDKDAESTTTQFGAQVGFAGFSIGGHWAKREDDGDGTALDVEGFMTGVGYKTGPWNIALTWLNTKDDVSMNAGEVEHNQYTLGMTYSLGAGVLVGASIFQVDFQDEMMVTDLGADNAVGGDDANADTTTGGNDNEGWGALVGIRVNF
ncbi:MAG: porin [Rhodospirillales bacterium]|nr:porin [Rhodospirillales bacterium]